MDRSQLLDEAFLRLLASWQPVDTAAGDLDAPVRPGTRLDGRTALELFESQIACRHLDLEARALKRRDEGYYTIGSAGHEGNVVLGRLVRATDPAYLHYRSGALMVERARQVPGATPIFDILLSLVASSDDPVSGGRHKVFGGRDLWVPAQTSTIASHLPKAVGAAFAIGRAPRLGVDLPVPHDAIVLCSFGDAGVNHNVAQGALNAAGWTAFQNLPLPVLFVCEDNGLGISVRTPTNWVFANMHARPGIRYFSGNGLDLASAWDAARAAVEYCRQRRRPAFLHLSTVRLLGHAGSDVETEYRTREEIESWESMDPLVSSARLVVEAGVVGPDGVRGLYEELRERVRAAARDAVRRPRLTAAAEVAAPLRIREPEAVLAEARRGPDARARQRIFGGDPPEADPRPRHMAVQINRALADGLARYPEMLVFGEDVARKGGVYHVTAGLSKAAGGARVFNTLLDETTILGLANGAGNLGLLPVPEIQYLAYYHNAEDQIRGEACSTRFFNSGRFSAPMVIRIASFGYQKGFGGHFHNDNSIAALRDVPGLLIAVPARGDDAVLMMRTALAAARTEGAITAFLEPIALYMTKDLHEPGDGAWLTSYPDPGEAAPIGRGRVWREAEGGDLTIVTYANGVWLSLRAARTLEERHGIRARVVDLCWLQPLDADLVESQARATGRVLIVDEGRRSGGVHEALAAVLVERFGRALPAVGLVVGEDSYVPLGPAAASVLPAEADIVERALRLMSVERARRDAP